MPSSVVCRCLFRLMRRYFLGRWICLLVSERLRLVWQCCPFGCNTYILPHIRTNIYIYIYIYNSFKYPVRWQKLLGSARRGNTALSYRNCVITPGWRLMRAEYRTCFHTLDDEKYIYIYIYTQTRTNIPTALKIHTHTYAHTHIHTHIYIYIYSQIYLSQYRYAFTQPHRYAYPYIYMHTHIAVLETTRIYSGAPICTLEEKSS